MHDLSARLKFDKVRKRDSWKNFGCFVESHFRDFSSNPSSTTVT